jgi:hypothetical protein
MQLGTTLFVSWLIGNAQFVLGRTSGNVCEIPEGPFEKSCTNIAVEFCQNNQYAETPCKLTADCDPDGQLPYNYSSFNTLMFPEHTTYLNVENNNGSISHPVLDEINKELKKEKQLECNPCFLPEGNYKESCIKFSVTYLHWLDEMSVAPCLFQADCQQDMRRNEHRYKHSPRSKDIHNEAMLRKYVKYKDVKNHDGVVKHPANQFEVTTNQCLERRSTEEVAVSKASRFKADRTTTGLAMVAGAAMVLKF